MNKHTIRSDCLEPPDHCVDVGGFFFKQKKNEGMKAQTLLFLPVIIWGGNTYAATDGYINVSQTAMLCPYGSYRVGTTCVDMTTQPSECSTIDIADKTYSTYLLNVHLDTFRYKEFDNTYPCYGSYSLYEIASSADTERVLITAKSGGTYYDALSGLAKTCPYGSYHLNGVCVEYDSVSASDGCHCTTDPVSGAKTCDNMTVAEQASFMAVNTEELPECLGDYTKYAHTKVTTTDGRIYPLFNGTYLSIGNKIDVFEKMLTDNPCQFNSDEYYSINILSDNTIASFMHPERGMCDTESSFQKFIVNTDCKDIKTKSDVDANEICGVLCTGAGEVYTNSGRCSTDGYCENGDKKLRLHVARPDGEKYSYPLYASKTSDPAMHFKFINASGNEQMCYVNLVPTEAIEHFVGEKPNPIRTMFYNPATGENETLITID